MDLFDIPRIVLASVHLIQGQFLPVLEVDMCVIYMYVDAWWTTSRLSGLEGDDVNDRAIVNVAVAVRIAAAGLSPCRCRQVGWMEGGKATAPRGRLGPRALGASGHSRAAV